MSQTVTVVLSILVFLFLAFATRRRRHRLPPGPPGLPVLGNYLDLPTDDEWLTYKDWSRKYGSDIIHLRVFGADMIVINTAEAVQEIFERRSNNYSDKVQSVMLHELTGWGRGMAFMSYSNRWRSHRRMFHQYFRGHAIPVYRPAMRKGVISGLALLLESPDSFLEHLRFIAASTITNVTYAIDIQPRDDLRLKIAEEAVQVLVKVATAGSYLVDYIPILKYIPEWFPGATFKKQARAWKPVVDKMWNRPYMDVKAAYKGDAKPCVLTSIFESLGNKEIGGELQETIINVTGAAYIAGTDTTVTVLSSFVLAMLLHPNVQSAAQQELDRVIGRSSLPELEDRDSLPYITAVLYEVLRWRPAFPMGIAHQSIAHDKYKGYHIPARSVIFGNVWAILHDEQRYPGPETFNPSRFLAPDGSLDPNVPEPIEGFGFSRRICAGRHFALDMTWLTIANILASFSIKKHVDEQGRISEPTGRFTSGLMCAPEPFKAMFNPRYAEVVNLIHSDPAMRPEEPMIMKA